MIKTIYYISNKNSNIVDDELENLLHSIISRNNRLGITGILLLQNNHFFQIMEGQEKIIDDIFGKIMKDNRHHGFIRLLDMPIADRVFEDYDSGYFSVITDFSNLKKLKIYFNWIENAGIIEVNKLIELTRNFLLHNK